ncbi:MAG TPA: calcineurin-like phosphoesterase family protein [Pirellulaceae bacterium]|nr:calcineurin-like phosphoesterase family protein [Pirellulaceae bacterium]
MKKPDKPLAVVRAKTGSGRYSRRQFVMAGAALGISAGWLPHVGWGRPGYHPPSYAQGRVFHNRDGSGRFGVNNPGLRGALVSNGREVTQTDEQGKWSLPVDGESVDFFVIKPRGWKTALDADHLPRFTYTHAPGGSPELKFGGLAPTGALPESIDFGLLENEEADQFKALFCGDPQPRDAREIGYLARTVVPHFRGTDAAFGISLGDIMFDDLSLYPLLNSAFGKIGIPWLNVLGNHDLDFDANDNLHAFDTFRRTYGASYYSFDWGPVHFLVLNNVEWTGADPAQGRNSGSYRGFLGERQLAFVENDLRHVPRDRLVVIAMHIPLTGTIDPRPAIETVDRQELYKLLADFPHTLSFSAHMHWHGHVFVDRQAGWLGPHPHHHIITGTLCGCWFGGAPGVDGVPHGTMSDGAPRGYLEVEFDGNRYRIDGYRGLQLPANHQMNIIVPDTIAKTELSNTVVFANVFNGSERSQVRIRFGEGDTWREMTRTVELDPAYVALRARDEKLELPYRKPANPSPCFHLWCYQFPETLAVGTHLIEVAAIDMHGHEHYGTSVSQVS